VFIFIRIFLVGAARLFYLYFSRSRSSKVNNIGANRKRICDFLLVRLSNFGPILHRSFEIRPVLCASDPTLFNPNFAGVPVASDRPCWASTSAWALSYSAVKLFSKNSNLREHCTVPKRYRQTDGQIERQTDGQADDMQSHNRALRSI